jgi:hypothetical protein
VKQNWRGELSSVAKTILFWCALLLIGVLLYQVLHRTSMPAQTAQSGGLTLKKKIEYNVVQVDASVLDIREKLESGASSGWEFVSPIVQNGTTTALIFKRENK